MPVGAARVEPDQNRIILNAVCLADFGDSGVGFVAMPQISPRNVNWSSRGRHIHLAKLAFEKYFLHKGARRPRRAFLGALCLQGPGNRQVGQIRPEQAVEKRPMDNRD